MTSSHWEQISATRSELENPPVCLRLPFSHSRQIGAEKFLGTRRRGQT